MQSSKTKETRYAEKDKLHKAYKAVTAQINAERRERIPGVAAFADWLLTNPSPDERHAALSLLTDALIEVDGMADPLPHEPPSTFLQLLPLVLTRQHAPRAAPKTEPTPMLTITIANSEDAARLPALLASVLAQFGGTAPVTAAPYEHTASFVQEPAPAVEAPAKRTRRTKAEMEAAAAPVVEEVQPEPVVVISAGTEGLVVEEAPVVVEEVDVVEPPVVEEVAQVIVEEPAKAYTDKDVLAALQAFAKAAPGNVPKITAIMESYGARKLVDLKPEHYAAVIAAVAV